jgi:multiple sugar transport system substrate-binding protein
MLPWIWQIGGEVVDDPMHPTRLELEGAATREALEFVINLAHNDGVVPFDNAHADRFVAGNVAMYIDSRVFTPTLREAAEFDWDVAPLPQGQQPANVLHSDGYCMAGASKVKDAAWQFIEYAIGDEGQTIASQLGRTVPSLRHLAESPVFLDADQPPAAAQVWLDNLDNNIRVIPKIENWNAIERTAANEFEQAYLGQQSLDDAIANIEAMAADGFIPMK